MTVMVLRLWRGCWQRLAIGNESNSDLDSVAKSSLLSHHSQACLALGIIIFSACLPTTASLMRCLSIFLFFHERPR
jgi:hypothetical protein